MIKTYISWLSAQNKKLLNEYGKVRLTLILTPLLLFLIYFVVAFLIRDFGSFYTNLNSLFLPIIISSSSYLIALLINKKICYPIIKNYKCLYHRAQEICNQIVDEADWTTFRKRDLYNNRRTQVIGTVEEFYKIRNKRFFPYQTINSYYIYIRRMIYVLNILIIIEIITIATFSISPNIYFTIKKYLASLS